MLKDNPIKAAWEARNLSCAEFALLAGVDSSMIYQVANGRLSRPGPAVLKALARLGYDSKQLANEYVEWRQALAEECLARKLAAAQ